MVMALTNNRKNPDVASRVLGTRMQWTQNWIRINQSKLPPYAATPLGEGYVIWRSDIKTNQQLLGPQQYWL